MGLQLPGELISLLGMLGYTWPEADETKLFELGSTWSSFAGRLNDIADSANAAAHRVLSENTGKEFEAFRADWSGEESAVQNLQTAARSCLATGIGLFVAAGIVLALKINVIVQLVLLAIQIAQAIAAAPATFGASLGWVPIAKQIAGFIIEMLIDQAIGALLGS